MTHRVPGVVLFHNLFLDRLFLDRFIARFTEGP